MKNTVSIHNSSRKLMVTGQGNRMTSETYSCKKRHFDKILIEIWK